MAALSESAKRLSWFRYGDGSFMREANGGYPIVYYGAAYGSYSEYCVDCANQDNAEPPIVDADVYYEGPDIVCYGCGAHIPSAYGDPNEESED